MACLGAVTTIPNAGQINALQTLNLRPETRKTWGFDDRKARSMTDATDGDPNMPDALETAAALDKKFKETGKLVGPLHGVVISLKDQYDTFDMRSTSGSDAAFANDRPPDDATFVARLRAAGAIILAKANLAEFANGGARSSFGGVFCNPYDTDAFAEQFELGIGLVGRGESRDVLDRRRDRLVDARSCTREQRGRHRADAGAHQPRRHDPERHQHPRRADLSHGRGCRARIGCVRGLRSERRAHGFQHRPQTETALPRIRDREAPERRAHRRRTRADECSPS